MTVFRISRCKFIDDLSGMGAAMYGGRWNDVGFHIVYTAGSPSLAMLESLVHFGGRIMGDYCQAAIEIPDNNVLKITENLLPANWRDSPPPYELRKIGNKFLIDGKHLILKVPSVLVPEESNFLLNPEHPDFKKVQLLIKTNIKFDKRFVENQQ